MNRHIDNPNLGPARRTVFPVRGSIDPMGLTSSVNPWTLMEEVRCFDPVDLDATRASMQSW